MEVHRLLCRWRRLPVRLGTAAQRCFAHVARSLWLLLTCREPPGCCCHLDVSRPFFPGQHSLVYRMVVQHALGREQHGVRHSTWQVCAELHPQAQIALRKGPVTRVDPMESNISL